MFALSKLITKIKQNMIKQSIVDKIRKSRQCKAALQLALDKSAPTIQRYLDSNHIMLTTPKAVEAISTQLGVNKENIFEQNQIRKPNGTY